MQTDIVLVVLFAAILHASWNAMMKVQGDRFMVITLMAFFMSMIGLPFIFYFGLPTPQLWPYVIASGVIHFIYKLMLINAYQHGDFGQVYPIARGGAPLLLLLASLLFLADVKFTNWEIIGSVTLTSGLLLLIFNRGFKSLLANGKGILFAIITAMAIASYTYVDSIGTRISGNALQYMAYFTFADGVPIFMYMLIKRKGSVIPAIKLNYKNGLITAGLSFLSYFLFLWATTHAPIALIASVRETSVIFAVLIGIIFLKEKLGIWKILAAITVLAGLVIMRI
ncbi:MAG: EamA family transporter [Rhizobiales bacterium]|nr:DMT family transporter [Hyphomicrobiales bacterium]NRB14795.1 EamA family transporter [Hyphomicrobiales bacterium]